MNTTLGITCGRTLRVGEVLKAGDWRYTGYGWEPVPTPCFGHCIQARSGMVYVRPQESFYTRK